MLKINPANAKVVYDKTTRMLSVAQREFLRVYRPFGEQINVHRCKAREILIYGGKRAGKSVCTTAEFVSRVLGLPIILPDNRKIMPKYPVSTPDNPLTYWIIGLDMRHIGKTIYRLLFSRGMRNSIRVIKDKWGWRIFNPNNPEDKERAKESRLCGPAIPPRFIEKDSFVWESAKAREFRSVRLTNGAIIRAFPSTADHPGMGDAVDGIWINEDIAKPDHLYEWQDRLIDRDGWLIWDAYPQMQNHAIVEMYDRAESQKDEEDPDIASFQLISTDNPFASKEGRERGLRRMGDEEAVARRNRGDLLRGSYLMYDFVPAMHIIRKRGPDEDTDENEVRRLLESLYSANGRMPDGWARFLSIDPSHTRTAVLSGVIPPLEYSGIAIGRKVIIEWEFVARKFTPDVLAESLKPLVAGFRYTSFIIDRNQGRQHTVGSDGRAVTQVYADAFDRFGITSTRTRSGFEFGTNATSFRRNIVREMLATIENGLPMLLFCEQNTIETQKEFNKYMKKVIRVNGVEDIVDEPANPRVCDCMQALEYLCAYVKPEIETGDIYRSNAKEEKAEMPGWLKKLLEETDPNRFRKGSIHLGPGMVA